MIKEVWSLKLRVGDRVMVYFPRDVQGKAWKFARPYYGPYTVLSLTPTNAEVCLLSCPEGDTIFVALDRIRPCYAEMSDEVWAGHGYRGPAPKKTVKRRLSKVKNCDFGLTPTSNYRGPMTRSRSSLTPLKTVQESSDTP